MSDLTLDDKINVMRAKKDGASILIRPKQQTEMANGDAPWSKIDNPEFNWSVADYKVESDKRNLIEKVKETVDYNKMYNAVHTYERGRQLPDFTDYVADVLTNTKVEVEDAVNTFITSNASALLSFDLDTFKKTDAYTRIYNSLYDEYFDKARRDIENNPALLATYNTNDAYYEAVYAPQVNEIISSMLQELNNVLISNCESAIISGTNDTVARGLDKTILEQKVKSEEELIDELSFSSEDEIKERVINHIQTACDKYLENDTRTYNVSYDENINVTIVRDKDNMVPAVSISLVLDKQTFYDDDIPAIDYEIIGDKLSHISNITTTQLESLVNQIDTLSSKIDDFDNGVATQVKTYVSAEIPSIKDSIANLSESVSRNYQELNTAIKEMKTATTVSKPIAYQGAGFTKTVIDFMDNTETNYGHGMLIGGEGTVVIGSGESVKTVKENYGVTANSENMLVTGDKSVNIITNLNGGMNSKKEFVFGTDGSLNVPGSLVSTSDIKGTSIEATDGLTAKSITSGSSIKGASIEATNTITAGFITSNNSIKGNSIEATDSITAKSITSSDTIKSTSIEATSGITANTITSSSIKGTSIEATNGITAGSITSSSSIEGPSIKAINGLTAGSIISNSSIEGSSIKATNDLTAGSITSSSIKGTSIEATNGVTADSISSNSVTSSSIKGTSIEATGNLTADSIKANNINVTTINGISIEIIE